MLLDLYRFPLQTMQYFSDQSDLHEKFNICSRYKVICILNNWKQCLDEVSINFSKHKQHKLVKVSQDENICQLTGWKQIGNFAYNTIIVDVMVFTTNASWTRAIYLSFWNWPLYLLKWICIVWWCSHKNAASTLKHKKINIWNYLLINNT